MNSKAYFNNALQPSTIRFRNVSGDGRKKIVTENVEVDKKKRRRNFTKSHVFASSFIPAFVIFLIFSNSRIFLISNNTPRLRTHHEELLPTLGSKNRIFFMDLSMTYEPSQHISRTVYEEAETIEFRENPPSEPRPIDVEAGCVPMAKWQTQSFPTCNLLHEMETGDENIVLLGRGGVRNVWRVNPIGGGEPDVVLKTLRWKLPFDAKNFDSQNKDALAMERLTKSPHVVNVHGYCGQSALNEIINPVSLNSADLSSKRKLIFARDAAEALADVHTIDNGNVTLIHRDVAGANFVLSRDGKSLMINDFNTARLQYWNVAESKPCGFKRQDCNDYRSPEECRGSRLSEKIDVYALANVFYKIITSEEPYHYPVKISQEQKYKMITREVYPPIPKEWRRTDIPEIKAIFTVMAKMYNFNPEERPSAAEVAAELNLALQSLGHESTPDEHANV